jgi:hypothetical protein
VDIARRFFLMDAYHLSVNRSPYRPMRLSSKSLKNEQFKDLPAFEEQFQIIGLLLRSLPP